MAASPMPSGSGGGGGGGGVLAVVLARGSGAPREAGRRGGTRRAGRARRPSANPRGTTATSSGVWFSNIRSLASRYASKEPCRSRWSGSRLSRTAMRGRKLSMSSSWKLESSQTTRRRPADGRRRDRRAGARRCRRPPPGARSAEDGAEQLARRRLPVRAGDPEHRLREEPRAELDLAPDGDAAARAPRARAATPRVPRALDDELDGVEQRLLLLSEANFDAVGAKPARVQLWGPVDADDYARLAARGRGPPPAPSARGRGRVPAAGRVSTARRSGRKSKK